MPSQYVFVIIVIAIVALTIIILASMFVGEKEESKGKKKKGGKDNPEELQQLADRCHRLSSRIEALETIIIENERNPKSKSSHD
ncbi:MAG: hypothetical protein ACPGN3_00850 [Opitutales bacterium]